MERFLTEHCCAPATQLFVKTTSDSKNINRNGECYARAASPIHPQRRGSGQNPCSQQPRCLRWSHFEVLVAFGQTGDDLPDGVLKIRTRGVQSWLELELLGPDRGCRTGSWASGRVVCASRRGLGSVASVRSYVVGGRVCRRQLPDGVDGAAGPVMKRRRPWPASRSPPCGFAFRTAQRSLSRRAAYSRADFVSVIISGDAHRIVAGVASSASAARTTLHVIRSGR